MRPSLYSAIARQLVQDAVARRAGMARLKDTAFITIFSLHPDGRWLTTGEQTVIRGVDRAGLDVLVAQHAGPGVRIHCRWRCGRGVD